MGKEQINDHLPHRLPIGMIDHAIREQREITHKFENYTIQTFTETNNPSGAFRAQQIQGESYVAAGFVYPSGLDEYGRLLPELDRSRGDNVTYKLATAINGDPADQAALRIIPLSEGGRLEDMAAYKYCKDDLFEGAAEALELHIAEYGPESLKEIAALSKADKAGQLSSFELIRNVVQEAVRDETNEAWLITFAKPAFDAIQKNFGPRSLTQIGNPVQVDVGDPRTSDKLRLIPTIIKPCQVLDGLLLDLDEAEPVSDQHRIYVRTLLFLADGMKESELSEAVYDRVKPFIA